MIEKVVQAVKTYQYKVGKEIGYGSFGFVCLVTDSQNQQKAVKRVAKEDSTYHLQEQAVNKLIMGNRHRNIIAVERVFRVPKQDGDLYIVMQYCDAGNMDENRWDFSAQELFSIMREVLEGLKFMHSNGIVHRDIKPSNILLKRQNGKIVPKLCDFGVSRTLQNDELSWTMVGTQPYMAPDYDKGFGYDTGVDVWAFGATFYELITGETPFASPEGDKLQIARKLKVLPRIFSTIFKPGPQRQTIKGLLSGTFSSPLSQAEQREVEGCMRIGKIKYLSKHSEYKQSFKDQPILSSNDREGQEFTATLPINRGSWTPTLPSPHQTHDVEKTLPPPVPGAAHYRPPASNHPASTTSLPADKPKQTFENVEKTLPPPVPYTGGIHVGVPQTAKYPAPTALPSANLPRSSSGSFSARDSSEQQVAIVADRPKQVQTKEYSKRGSQGRESMPAKVQPPRKQSGSVDKPRQDRTIVVEYTKDQPNYQQKVIGLQKIIEDLSKNVQRLQQDNEQLRQYKINRERKDKKLFAPQLQPPVEVDTQSPALAEENAALKKQLSELQAQLVTFQAREALLMQKMQECKTKCETDVRQLRELLIKSVQNTNSIVRNWMEERIAQDSYVQQLQSKSAQSYRQLSLELSLSKELYSQQSTCAQRATEKEVELMQVINKIVEEQRAVENLMQEKQTRYRAKEQEYRKRIENLQQEQIKQKRQYFKVDGEKKILQDRFDALTKDQELSNIKKESSASVVEDYRSSGAEKTD